MTDRRESEFTLGTMEYDKAKIFLVSEHSCCCSVFMHRLNSVIFFLPALVSKAAFSQVPSYLNDRWHHSVLSSLYLHDR